MRHYRQLLPYILPQWRSLLVIGLVTLLSAAVAALQPWPIKIVVDYGLSQQPIPAWLESICSFFGPDSNPVALFCLGAAATLLVFALGALVESILAWRWTVTGQQMVGALARDVFDRLLHLPLRAHHRRPVGDSLSRLSTDCWCVYKLTDGLLISPVQKAFTVLTLGAVAWQIHAELALYALLTAPLIGVATAYFGGRIRRRVKRGREAQSRLLTFVHQTLSTIPIVQAFGSERRNRQRYQDLAAEAVTLSQQGSLQTSAYRLVTGTITTSGLALILFLGGQHVIAGTLSLGSFLVFLAYMKTLQNAAESLVDLYSNLKPIEVSVERVLEILQSQPDDAREAITPVPWPATPGGGARVQFSKVTFGYETGRPILQEISLEAKPGEMLAVVGSSGAGKTTLVSVLTRLYDPWEGQILINGIDTREMRLADLRRRIGVVPQEPFLLPLSVAENIAYGCPDASRQAIEAAARAASAEEFILDLDQGYDTLIGERGATLSGGQRQRLALARAYLKDAPILILDEPSSALDNRTEATLLKALDHLRKERTVFVIAHRLSTIRLADHILVLEGGRIVQRGRHEELLLAGGTYQDLYQLQSSPGGRELAAV